MSVVQTVLVFVGIPLGIVAVFAALIFGGSQLHQSNRYRPGKPWRFQPVWYIPHPEAVHVTPSKRAVGGPAHQALESGTAPTPAAVGGASGEW